MKKLVKFLVENFWASLSFFIAAIVCLCLREWALAICLGIITIDTIVYDIRIYRRKKRFDKWFEQNKNQLNKESQEELEKICDKEVDNE